MATVGEASSVFKERSKPITPSPIEEKGEPQSDTEQESQITMEQKPPVQTALDPAEPTKPDLTLYIPPHLRGLSQADMERYVKVKSNGKGNQVSAIPTTKDKDGSMMHGEDKGHFVMPKPSDSPMNEAVPLQSTKLVITNTKTVDSPRDRVSSDSTQSGVKLDSDLTWEPVEKVGMSSPSNQTSTPTSTVKNPTTVMAKSKKSTRKNRDEKSGSGHASGWDKVKTDGPDPNEHSDLVDFDGNFAPAPNEWEHRALYIPKQEQNKTRIQSWSASATPCVVDINSPDFINGAGLATGEENFEAAIKEDVHETKPYGDPFTNLKGSITTDQALERFAPELEKRKAEKARIAAEEQSHRELTRKERKETRAYMRKQQEYLAKLPKENAPKANIYLRPAKSEDLYQVKDIYDYYVNESTVAPEREEVAIGTWQARFDDIQAEKHPFIVAIKRGRIGGDGTRRHTSTGKEHVVGFALAEDIGVNNSIYRYTCEAHVYVHHSEFRQDIGDCLLDRLLARSDMHYVPRRGVEWFGGESDYKFHDHKIVSLNFPYAAGREDKTLDWVKKWLGKYYFEHTGTLPGYGYKLQSK